MMTKEKYAEVLKALKTIKNMCEYEVEDCEHCPLGFDEGDSCLLADTPDCWGLEEDVQEVVTYKILRGVK